MPNITIKDSHQVIEYKVGKDLLSILLDESVFVDNPCNGRGSCGKCKVRYIEGNNQEISPTEHNFLKEDEIKAGIRLACLIEPKDDITIELLQEERKHEVLDSGYIPKFEFQPAVYKKTFEIKKPTLYNQTPYEDAILAELGVSSVDWKLLQQLPIAEDVSTAVFYNDKLIAVESGDTKGQLYGIAIDIGTTTVVTALIDMTSGKELANSSMINAQKNYGLDVLTRITYELEHPEDGREKLQTAIVNSMNEMIGDTCRQANIDRSNIYEISVAGNCTMMHFLLGIDARTIGKSPYAPLFVKAKNIPARDIGLLVSPSARLYCLPSVSSYIGADIVAGAYVCQLEKSNENVLFIDIGTNGEIVLSNHGKLLSCSCAAGPALEGMNISSGMRAAQGAIEDVIITEDGVELKVIGDEAPIGICGSGILAVVKELIRIGIVRKDGAFIKKDVLDESDYRYDMIHLDGRKREFILAKEPKLLMITQGDIRQVQLAKGAILSGFYALLKKAGIKMNDLEKVMIAGQFGTHVSAESLVGIGILPKEVKDKIVYVGNSSKTGAYMALMSVEVKRQMEELALYMDYMELGATDGYERLFAECLSFV